MGPLINMEPNCQCFATFSTRDFKDLLEKALKRKKKKSPCDHTYGLSLLEDIHDGTKPWFQTYTMERLFSSPLL